MERVYTFICDICNKELPHKKLSPEFCICEDCLEQKEEDELMRKEEERLYEEEMMREYNEK